MVLTCDNCGFIFSRTDETDQCPDCGKHMVRPSNEEEQAEFAQRMAELTRSERSEAPRLPSIEDTEISMLSSFSFRLPATALHIQSGMIADVIVEYGENPADRSELAGNAWARPEGGQTAGFLMSVHLPAQQGESQRDQVNRIFTALNDSPAFQETLRSFIMHQLEQDGQNAVNLPQYRLLSRDELCRDLFHGFIRRQVVTKCWRKEQGSWVVRDDPFIDDWSEADYHTLVSCLRNTAETGGAVYGAFLGGVLKGFASIEPDVTGDEHRYMDLSSIHVSQDVRGRGIGGALFGLAKDWARLQGARKLYISAHSAVESQAFYQKMGCVEAAVYDQKHVDAEPFDCQLECSL